MMVLATEWRPRLSRVALLLLVTAAVALMVFVVAYSMSHEQIHSCFVVLLHYGVLGTLAALFLYLYRFSRILPANIVLAIWLCYAVEVGFFVLLGMPPLTKTYCPAPGAPQGTVEHCMGSLPPADTAIHRTVVIDGDTVCDITMTTDRFHKRVTPDHTPENQQFAMFLGCSIVFGEGVEDDETMPWHFQQLSGEYNAYNFGANGHATNHVLARFTCENLRKQVPEKVGVAFYIFFWDHVWRANGSMNRYVDWLSGAPYYKLRHEKLLRDRSFRDGRKWVSLLYRLLSNSSIVKYYELDFPVKLRKKHVELVAEMVTEARNQFKKQFDTDAFYFVYYPEWGEPDPALRAHLSACLKASDIEIIDLSMGRYHQEMTLGWDPHPSSVTHQRLAGDLLQYICSMNKNP
jgi:hypothetical protein